MAGRIIQAQTGTITASPTITPRKNEVPCSAECPMSLDLGDSSCEREGLSGAKSQTKLSLLIIDCNPLR
jgi:hypothetical protein